MTPTPARLVRLGVAVVTDAQDRLLLTWNDPWAAYTLPMSKLRRDPPEAPADAAVRVGAEALGGVARLVRPGFPETASTYLLSGRDLAARHYEYNLFRVEPTGPASIRRRHVWLPLYLARRDVFGPLSPSVEPLVGHVRDAFRTPERVQPTAALLVTRPGPQFLLRWNPHWRRFTLPTKRRRDGESPHDAAARVARLELGDGVVIHEPPTEVAIDDRSQGDEDSPAHLVPTRYVHAVYGASERPGAELPADLLWATAAEVLRTQTADGRAISTHAKTIVGRLGFLHDELAREAAEYRRYWLEKLGLGDA